MKLFALFIYVTIGLGAAATVYDRCRQDKGEACAVATVVVAIWPMAIGTRLWAASE